MEKLKYEPWYYEETENEKMYNYVKTKYVDSGIEPNLYFLLECELEGKKLIIGKTYLTPSGYFAELLEIKGHHYIFGV